MLPVHLAVQELQILCTDSAMRARILTCLEDAGTLCESIRQISEPRECSETLLILYSSQPNYSRESLLIVKGREEAPAVCVLAEPDADLRLLLSAGADGLVLTLELEGTLPGTLAAVAAGQTVVPRNLRPALSGPVLSPREKRVLGMVVMGFSNQEIASRLYISGSTVKSHLSNSFRKLGVTSRQEAATLILDEERGLGPGILGIPGT